MALGNRTAPAPFDLIWGDHGWMVARDKDGRLAYRQVRQQVVGNVLTRAARPFAVVDPIYEVPRGFFSFIEGMGFQEEATDPALDTNGYEHGEYVDSPGGVLMNGPKLTSVTPASTGAIKQFFEMNVGGTRKLCALASRYVLVRNADNAAGWVVSKDLGSGKVGSRVAVFRGTEAGDFAFVAMGEADNYWVWDGASDTTTWTQEAANKASAFAVWRDELWRLCVGTGGAYVVAKSTDGGAGAVWGSEYPICDRFNTATDLAVHDDRLFVGAEQGLYAPTADPSDFATFRVQELTPSFKYQRNANNGRGLHSWYKWLFTPMASSLFRYDIDGGMTEMGLGTLKGNRSEVQGRCTALCGYRNFTLFAVFYNEANTTSYLMRWGDWQLMEGADGPQRVFVPGWHGYLYKWTGGVTIDAMIVTEVAGVPRLYLGGSDGQIHYLRLPRYSMDWRSDSGCEFNTANPGVAYFPAIHHGAPLEDKTTRAVGVAAENLSAGSRSIQVAYRTTPGGSFAATGAMEGGGLFTADPGARQEVGDGAVSKWLQLKATLTTTTTATPVVLKAIAAFQALSPAFRWLYQFSLQVGDEVVNHHGQPLARFFGEPAQRAELERLAADFSGDLLITPTGARVNAQLRDLELLASGKEKGARLSWVARCTAIALGTELADESTYADLEAQGTYSALESRTYEQLENL